MNGDVYYNENDPKISAWLRCLAEEGHVPKGHIDERSIADVERVDARQAHFFAGIGGWPLALRYAGVPEDANVWTGSCPCQPFSQAGRGRGTKDERHLWPEWRRLIEISRPAVVFGEQVASPAGRKWLAAVRAEMEALGYAVGAADLCAAGIGAPHLRQRLFFVAYTAEAGRRREGPAGETARTKEESAQPRRHSPVVGLAVADGERREGERVQLRERPARQAVSQVGGGGEADWLDVDWIPCADGKARPAQPGTFPLAHGVPGRLVKLRGYGNAIVPALAAEFVRAAFEVIG